MKILFIIDSLGSGGAQRQLVSIVKGLDNRKFEIEVLVYSDNMFFEHSLVEAGIQITKLFSSNKISRIIEVRKHIRNGNYNCVVSFLDTPNILNLIATIGGKRWKVITSERSANKQSFLRRRHKTLGFLQRRANYIVCNSDNAKSIWLNYHPKLKNKLLTIYNLVLLSDITTTYIPKRNGKINIVVPASYRYIKNLHSLTSALLKIDRDILSRIHIDWYGNIKISSECIYENQLNLIKANGLDQTIQLHDATHDIQNKMNEADIIGLFSYYEGLPNAICEGMMLGKPIIMSKVSDYNRLVDDNNGFLCDSDDMESIKNTLIKASELNEKELSEMGVQSKNKAMEMFSLEKIINEWEYILLH